MITFFVPKFIIVLNSFNANGGLRKALPNTMLAPTYGIHPHKSHIGDLALSMDNEFPPHLWVKLLFLKINLTQSLFLCEKMIQFTLLI